jgi:hypothetical protein
MERLASDFIPTVMARGFHAGPVFGIFGAAVAMAKIKGFSEDQVNGAIAQCANLAGGNLEGARSGGQALREGGAVRNALLAVALAGRGMRGGDTVLEGEAGFYHSYAGNNRGQLTHAFEGPLRTDVSKLADGLGQSWTFLDTLYRIYSTPGFNIAHVDVTAAVCNENDIEPEDIDRIEAVVNWYETEYPSPAFPTPSRNTGPSVGSTHYFSAYGAVERTYPMLRGMARRGGETDPPLVLELMHKVTLIPMHNQTLFGPRVTVFTKDGKSYTKQASGREFIWDIDEEVRRLQGILPGIPIPESQFQELVDACSNLDALGDATRLIALTLASKG